MSATSTATRQPVTLFYTTTGRQKGWIVSYPTATGFQHVKVASTSSARPSDDELADKGYEVIGS